VKPSPRPPCSFSPARPPLPPPRPLPVSWLFACLISSPPLPTPSSMRLPWEKGGARSLSLTPCAWEEDGAIPLDLLAPGVTDAGGEEAQGAGEEEVQADPEQHFTLCEAVRSPAFWLMNFAWLCAMPSWAGLNFHMTGGSCTYRHWRRAWEIASYIATAWKEALLDLNFPHTWHELPLPLPLIPHPSSLTPHPFVNSCQPRAREHATRRHWQGFCRALPNPPPGWQGFCSRMG
jgi:hypothetical protein